MRCEIHGISHTDFSDGTSLCEQCLIGEIEKNRTKENEIWKAVFGVLSIQEQSNLRGTTSCCASLFEKFSQKQVLLWLIASMALRKGVLFEDILEIILEHRSIQPLYCGDFHFEEVDFSIQK